MPVTIAEVELPTKAERTLPGGIEIQTPGGFLIKVPPRSGFADPQELLAAIKESQC